MPITIHYSHQDKREITKSFVLSEVMIGRPKDIPIDLDLSPDTKVSRPHARLRDSLGTWWIEDLNSQNGTFVNGAKIHELTQLFPGDQLRLGDTTIRVEFAGVDITTVPGSFESQFPVKETEPPKEIPENLRLNVFENISKIMAYLQGRSMLEAFLKEIVIAFPHAEHCTIALIEDNKIVPYAVKPKSGSNMSFTLARQAIVSREAFHWKRDVDYETGNANISSLFDVISALYSPILCNGEVIGVIHVDTTSLQHQFSDEDLHLLSVMGNTMGPAIRASQEGSFGRLHHVFISSSTSETDQVWVDHLAADLRRRSIKVFLHEDIQPGMKKKAIISNAIKNLDAFLVACSQSSQDSEQVLNELKTAKDAEKTIMPLLIEPCRLPNFIRDLHPLDMSKKVYAKNVHRLVDVINNLPLSKPIREREKIKILFLAANPFETERLHLDQEFHEIDMRLRMTQFRDRFELTSHWAVRYSDISELLLRHKPHLVHFSGHGSRKGEIFLEDESGQAHPVSAKVLGRLFGAYNDHIHCVLLNACWSLKQAKAIVKEIDCVVGMSMSIGDDAAIRFAGGFYQALGYKSDLQKAFDLGCLEIDLANIPESSTPKLITKPDVNASDVYIE